MEKTVWGYFCLTGLLVLTTSPAFAAPDPFLQQEQLQQARQLERQRQERLAYPGNQLTEGMDETLPPPSSAAPAFLIDTIQFTGNTDVFPWLAKETKPYLHTKMDGNAINRLAAQLNRQLIDRGYVTSRVLVPEQNLASGSLRFVLQVGLFHAFVDEAGNEVPSSIVHAFPLHPGEVLNLRKLEQGLEQLNRLPSQKVQMKLRPAVIPFASDVELSVTRTNTLYGLVSLDDSGLKSTGKLQWNLELGLDQPFQQGDRLQIDLTGDGTRSGTEKGTRGQSVSYSFPYGWDTFNFYYSRYQYHQRVHLDPFPFLSEGITKTGKFTWDHVFYRSQKEKQSFDLSVRKRDSHSYLDHQELSVQTQHTTALEAGWNLREYLGDGVLYTRVAHRLGVGWLGAMPENPYEQGPKTRYHMWLLDADYQKPFAVGSLKALYTGSFHGQWTTGGDRLYGLDGISMGNRYTVRGFDGEYTLLGESGWYLRNEVAFPIKEQELYLGADLGAVYGPSTDMLVGHTIAGGVLGIRGKFPVGSTRMVYDAFVGIPFYKPEGYPTKSVTCGFMAGWRL